MALTSTGMTLADLLERFGAIPAARIRYDPPPGTATEQDVITLEARKIGCSSWSMVCWWRKLWGFMSPSWPCAWCSFC